eukprot:CAMPEP_0118950506 /NCGR_PEP_ID=MMETSP1169-20130426/51487_1 /TAXON_ID=36882 /ORGANISM="Pyramimonas obovata, Strain CCMP722" /LENGTH=487 /DNA_ID=CAMNT_0006897361 /DNA_START=181 /DNA_END=1640 /DNA_ORIENTATION=+
MRTAAQARAAARATSSARSSRIMLARRCVAAVLVINATARAAGAGASTSSIHRYSRAELTASTAVAAHRRIYSSNIQDDDDSSRSSSDNRSRFRRLSADCYNFGWNGRYNLNYNGNESSKAFSIRARPSLFGAFSIYTSNPFLGPGSAGGYDALEFNMRGPQALAMSLYLIPAPAAGLARHPGGVRRGLARVETTGLPLASLVTDPEVLRAAAASGGALTEWTTFRIDLGGLGAAGWERINWKDEGCNCGFVQDTCPAEADAFVVRYFPRRLFGSINLERICGGEFFLDDIRLVRYKKHPAVDPPAPPSAAFASPSPPLRSSSPSSPFLANFPASGARLVSSSGAAADQSDPSNDDAVPYEDYYYDEDNPHVGDIGVYVTPHVNQLWVPPHVAASAAANHNNNNDGDIRRSNNGASPPPALTFDNYFDVKSGTVTVSVGSGAGAPSDGGGQQGGAAAPSSVVYSAGSEESMYTYSENSDADYGGEAG